jgi:hypothetical protein
MRHLIAGILVMGLAQTGQAVSVLLFTEGFEVNTSNWLSGVSQAPNWSATGGVVGSGAIFTSGTIDTSGFGPIIFRGNNAATASGGAFVGNWLTAGVSAFSAYVWHDGPVALNFYARFDKGAGSAASSNNFLVAPSTWTQINIPILDSLGTSGQIFQSYGAAGSGGFSSIFSDIKNIQIALGAAQDASTHGQTYTVGLDSVSIVPEPGTGSLGLLGLIVLGAYRRIRVGQSQ